MVACCPRVSVGRIADIAGDRISIRPVVDLQRLSFVTILTMADDPGYAVDDIFDQSFQALPPDDDGFSLEGLNAVGSRTQADVSTNEGEAE